ncbi:hypothetical protein [Saccharothrix algeriensis]|uniref:Flp pilus assembly protein TadB n=1 Tax=Saccharothrix algeriensis TaxID=173560 RepID=A0ABS2S5K7_9PSEU|nr:hypothetical protein [Saccharothrix algeriensis]MBM7810593.1 Flp pilus assembly protein TadB [Saccharothrix algeriensis]
MTKKNGMDKHVFLALMALIALSAIGVVVTLNGGPVPVVIALLIACLACVAYMVLKAAKRLKDERRPR